VVLACWAVAARRLETGLRAGRGGRPAWAGLRGGKEQGREQREEELGRSGAGELVGQSCGGGRSELEWAC
jgi:hypothetical protein